MLDGSVVNQRAVYMLLMRSIDHFPKCISFDLPNCSPEVIEYILLVHNIVDKLLQTEVDGTNYVVHPGLILMKG
jgi:hypothetical protein